MEPKDRLELLVHQYNRGLITLQEYCDALFMLLCEVLKVGE